MDEERTSLKKQDAADGTAVEGGRVGPFQLGSSHEVGPGLGRLHEARHVGTGSPALVLTPGAEVDWQPEGPWRVEVSFEPELSSVTLEVGQSSASADVSDLANLLVMVAAAVERVEDNPQVQAHLLSAPVGSPLMRWVRNMRRRMPATSDLALAGFALLVLCLGLWRYATPGPAPQPSTSPDMASETLSQAIPPDSGVIAYPLPDKPSPEQAVAPCYPKLGEVEINSACWFELAQRAPCIDEVQAEYKGKCYVPISKERRPRKRPAQSIEP